MNALNKKTLFTYFKEGGIYVVLLVLLAIIIIQDPTFLSLMNLSNILTQSSVRIIIALGVAGLIVTQGTDLSAGRQVGLAAVLAALTQPEIAIVSLTISEKGYCHHPASGRLMAEHPAIAHDIAHPAQPQSAPGLLLAALRLRRERGLPPFAVMSCDNMPANGRVTRQVLLDLAQRQDPALADWVRQEVAFPSTMVDRIVPAATPATLDEIAAALGGVRDECAIACEPFIQWVVEDNFAAGRPAWELAGAQLVSDVLPFEHMKLRMLNGSHSFLAYLGYLGGYRYINECMADEHYRRAALRLMLDEQAPTLSVTGISLTDYAAQLIARFSNPALQHLTWQIAMDGSQKLPQRLLDAVRWHLRHGGDYSGLDRKSVV